MIDITKLKPADTGRYVIYSGQEEEEGTITSWNDKFIFVDYGNGNGVATEAKDLRFLTAQELALKEEEEADEIDHINDIMFPNAEDGDDGNDYDYGDDD